MIFKFVWDFWWLGKLKYFMSGRRFEAKQKALYRKQAAYFTTTAMDMGGLIIRLGQHVSAQVGVLPKEVISELSKLQDSVAFVDFMEIRDKVERELRAPISVLYSEFYPAPIAAASFGQVHRAILPHRRTSGSKGDAAWSRGYYRHRLEIHPSRYFVIETPEEDYRLHGP
ncbi:AarF/UbiB family protein [Paenibacillus sp. PastH-2]|uniref:AarF/UbiB family protein n=2 Tax=Paenibacillus TaxID=44249 RepID=UPI002475F75A|nr:AarF/UbiB family protein [Paenibacillus sp. PastH-2]MDH6478196.1 putative unusual protein kinase regulating ubiquinone biosynthesis (AarF/ABC1/UbiB family) [Paenibacillus sp. PastH-2]